MRIVCISDTHCRKFALPDGDVLIHAGDLSMSGSVLEVQEQLSSLNQHPHKHKILVPGNHDFAFQDYPEQLDVGQVVVLKNTGLTIDGLSFWGSPWQPEFFNWAFNLPRGESLRKVWAQMPDKLDVLITHSPPHGVGDWVDYGGAGHVGCVDMAARVLEVKPKLHVFGHVHAGYGIYERHGIVYVNASICNEKYRAVNKPVIIDL